MSYSPNLPPGVSQEMLDSTNMTDEEVELLADEEPAQQKNSGDFFRVDIKQQVKKVRDGGVLIHKPV